PSSHPHHIPLSLHDALPISGKFTAFVGWEWTVHPGGKNLHRVIFTTANAATAKKFLPFNANDSQRPEDLWQWLEKTSKETGAELDRKSTRLNSSHVSISYAV